MTPGSSFVITVRLDLYPSQRRFQHTMADANGRPRRVSMAFILGFSNKPFKDGGPPAPPPPRRPSAFKQMVSTSHDLPIETTLTVLGHHARRCH